MAPSIVLATANAAKRAQLRWLLGGLPLRPLEAPPREVSETAADLAGNAALKALAYSSEGLTIGSDGGLVVPALAGRWDPLRTHRQGQARLRELVRGLTDRRVRWSEAVAIADRGHLLASWTASGTQGVLAPEPWPEPTEFWVWDVFLFPRLGKTWSEIDATERNEVDGTWLALRREVRAFFGSTQAG